jgi:hypothetical protein
MVIEAMVDLWFLSTLTIDFHIDTCLWSLSVMSIHTIVQSELVFPTFELNCYLILDNGSEYMVYMVLLLNCNDLNLFSLRQWHIHAMMITLFG